MPSLNEILERRVIKNYITEEIKKGNIKNLYEIYSYKKSEYLSEEDLFEFVGALSNLYDRFSYGKDSDVVKYNNITSLTRKLRGASEEERREIIGKIKEIEDSLKYKNTYSKVKVSDIAADKKPEKEIFAGSSKKAEKKEPEKVFYNKPSGREGSVGSETKVEYRKSQEPIEARVTQETDEIANQEPAKTSAPNVQDTVDAEDSITNQQATVDNKKETLQLEKIDEKVSEELKNLESEIVEVSKEDKVKDRIKKFLSDTSSVITTYNEYNKKIREFEELYKPFNEKTMLDQFKNKKRDLFQVTYKNVIKPSLEYLVSSLENDESNEYKRILNDFKNSTNIESKIKAGKASRQMENFKKYVKFLKDVKERSEEEDVVNKIAIRFNTMINEIKEKAKDNKPKLVNTDIIGTLDAKGEGMANNKLLSDVPVEEVRKAAEAAKNAGMIQDKETASAPVEKEVSITKPAKSPEELLGNIQRLASINYSE